MKKLSKLIKVQSPSDGLPVLGVAGYGGEQDGSRVVFSGPHRYASRAAAEGILVPDYVRLHWGEYRPGRGWEIVLGWFTREVR